MLFKVKTLHNYTLHGLDKDIGKVKNVYFDDHRWGVRYLVVETGHWLTERQVLISPRSLVAVNEAEQTISVNLTRQQIEDSPDLGTDQPVSEQFENSYFSYYGWPSYWDGFSLNMDLDNWQTYTQTPETWDPRLRSMQNVVGYHIQAKDGSLGHVEDFIVDVDAWAVRYLIINTQNWWPGKKVLISPAWIESVSWKQSKIFVEHLRDTIKQAPEYKDITQLTRQAEHELHQYYDRHGYWIDELAAQELSPK